MLTAPGSDKILGATIVGAHAGELIAEFVLAMKHGLGLNKILGTIHAYPTWVEANKVRGGNWKRAHAPARVAELGQALPRLGTRLMRLSIVIPVLNEATRPPEMLAALQPLRARGVELIVADGGSGTAAASWPRPLWTGGRGFARPGAADERGRGRIAR